MKRLLKVCWIAQVCFPSGGTVRLVAPGAARTAGGWLTSLNILNTLLDEGVSGDWAGQSGGSG